MRASLAPVIAGAAVWIVAGCARDTDAGVAGARTVRRDSAGITIVENRRADSAAVPFWVIDTTPARTIGTLSGEPAYEFSSVKNVRELPNGTMLVLDGHGESAFEFRFFDSTGAHIATHGRRGDGPGEFRWVSFIGPAGGDTVVAVDFPARRISWVSASAGFVRSMPVDEPRLQALLGVTAPGISESMVVLSDSLFAVKAYARSEGATTPFERTTHFAIVDLARDSAIRIAAHPEPRVERIELSGRPSFSQVEIEGGIGTHVVDRTRRRMCAAYTRRPELVCRDDNGAQTVIRWQADTVPFTAGDRRVIEDRIRQNYGRSGPAGAADADRIIAAYVWPASYNPIQALLNDAEGNFWILEYALNGAGERHRRFRVLDPDGSLIAFASGFAVSPYGLNRAIDITANRVIRRNTDADGVEVVGVFPIQKLQPARQPTGD